MAGVRGRRWLAVFALAESAHQLRPPPVRPRLLVAQRLREKRVKDAVSFIGRFEEEIVRYAKKFSVDAVLCGHIHSAAIRQFGGVTYYNCGDWVETCSALIERDDGAVEMVNYHPFSALTSFDGPMGRSQLGVSGR